MTGMGIPNNHDKMPRPMAILLIYFLIGRKTL